MEEMCSNIWYFLMKFLQMRTQNVGTRPHLFYYLTEKTHILKEMTD